MILSTNELILYIDLESRINLILSVGYRSKIDGVLSWVEIITL